MIKSIKIYLTFLRKIIKSKFMYFNDFILSFVMSVISNLYTLIFIEIIFNNITVLGGWSLYEVLIMYGINSICRGIFCTLFGELDLLSDVYILDGKLDNLLLRPKSPIYLIITSNIYEENISDVFLGIIYLICSFRNIEGLLCVKNILILFISILVGTIMYFAFFLLVSSSGFWFNTRFSLMWSFMDVTEYSNYPLNIFPKLIRNILTWIVPFGLISFYPSIIIFDKMQELQWVGYLIPFMTIFFLVLALGIWRKGLEQYESIN